MARQVDRLARVGMEGFADIEELYGRGGNYRRPGGRVPYNVHLGNQVRVIHVFPPGDIDSNKAAQRFGGVVISDVPKGKPAAYNYRTMDRIDRF